MVSQKSVDKQLKQIHFNRSSWNKAELFELTNILMPDEKIFECVNGTYEGGIALLCATNVRLLLIDKKPLKFLTVEDLRFDMINQIDYSHRLFVARISVSAGTKNLQFRSVNKERLRKLIGHIQHRMAEIKKEQSTTAESQQQHLQRINEQLQAYLLEQHRQQEELRSRLQATGADNSEPALEPLKPSPQLSDYLFAQTLLKQYQESQPQPQPQPSAANSTNNPVPAEARNERQDVNPVLPTTANSAATAADLYSAGRQEILRQFQKRTATSPATTSAPGSLEINPLRVAYAKLPMALRNRAFLRRRQSTRLEPSLQE